MIRLAKIEDLKSIMNVIEDARDTLKQSGSKQWNLDNGYPDATDIITDIVSEQIYVYEDKVIDKILGCIVMCKDIDPNYELKNFWSNDETYVSIHRLAVLKDSLNKKVASSLLQYCIDNCDTVNVRIDTHKNNLIMIKLIEKFKFTFKGVITLQEIDEDNLKNAYELIKRTKV